MQGDEHPEKRALRDTRERTLQGLSTAFAKDELSLEEFERRVDAAFAAATAEELAVLLADLAPESRTVGGQTLAIATPNTELVGSAALTNAKGIALRRIPRAMAGFGNVERRGPMTLPSRSRILAVFGNVEMDLRDALVPSGGVEIEVRAVFGNIEITVPPHWTVSCEGIGIFGSFSSMHRVPLGESGTAPMLRITGTATFGNFEVHTLPAGVRRGTPKLLGPR